MSLPKPRQKAVLPFPTGYLLHICLTILLVQAIHLPAHASRKPASREAVRHVSVIDNTDTGGINCSADSTIDGVSDYWGMDTTGGPDDSIPPGTDAADSAEINEDLFQESLESLFKTPFSDIDTVAWDSTKIHGKRFDVTSWNDTAMIVLCDSLKKKRYVPPCCSTITSEFGQRRYRWHYGIDIKVRRGDSIRSAFDGIIRVIQYDRRGYGHVVVIRHANGLETLYGHLSQKLVVPRQCVKAGDVIGLGGNTGRSTGPHLHFELRYLGEAFNPRDWIDFTACLLHKDTGALSKSNFAYLIELRKAKWHTIRKGNTLGSIARRYHTSIAKLCSLNHITRRTILRVGRKIRYQ